MYCFRSSEELCQEADVSGADFGLGRALAKTRALSLTKTKVCMSKVSLTSSVSELLLVSLSLLLLFSEEVVTHLSKSITLFAELLCSVSFFVGIDWVELLIRS